MILPDFASLRCIHTADFGSRLLSSPFGASIVQESIPAVICWNSALDLMSVSFAGVEPTPRDAVANTLCAKRDPASTAPAAHLSKEEAAPPTSFSDVGESSPT